MTHTFLVLATFGLGHGVYKKLYTLIGSQRAEKFENHWTRRTIFCLAMTKQWPNKWPYIANVFSDL